MPHSYALDILVLLAVAHVLAAREVFEGRGETLCRSGARGGRCKTGLGACRATHMLAIVEAHIVVCGDPRVGAGIEDVFEEGNLALFRGEDEIVHLVNAVELGDDLERVALVDEEALALGRVEHFLRVFGHERVEECIKALVVSAFGAEDASETLGFLTTRAKVRRNLDQTRRLGEVDGCVADL